MSTDLNRLQEWLGRTESRSDQITPAPMAALSATLDRDDPPPRSGDPLPLLWHWLYFLPNQRHSEIGEDGHPKRGGFLPPAPLPRRMFAGARLQLHRPLKVGDTVSRVSRIAGINHKEGKSGSLLFVLVRHEISNAEGVALTEENDLVYRDQPKPGGPAAKVQAAPANPLWVREIQPNEVMLFRYSALSFNAHRIHYDRRYATEVEGYPGLVVQGVLIATLLADLLRRNLPDATISHFAFRAVSPLFDHAPFLVCGKPKEGEKVVDLWAMNLDGDLAMDATATIM